MSFLSALTLLAAVQTAPATPEKVYAITASKPGRWADVIAVRGNPLEGVEALSRVSFVMVGGKRYDGLSYR